MSKVYIGTSGYSYQHWRDVFYPRGTKENKWLEYYTKFFDTVELNVTFYRLPKEAAFASWRKRTPKNFRFTVKGSRFITHIKKLKDCVESLKLFFSRAGLLREKLGPVLWQLPPSFKADPKRLQAFLKNLKKYKKVQHVFEFRNETWYCKEIFDMLKDARFALCSADRPDFSKDIQITADFLYLRRHGQAAKLYSGCYSAKQLENDAEIIKKNLKEKRDVYIYFNNDTDGYAVKNALELKRLV
ncbi:MAG: DUF72 domain-containing protein [Candidatus Omnitrophica bacterium]|nr:DUF72 domain-containing protein [Candidatus Omnitrophota bacterium]